MPNDVDFSKIGKNVLKELALQGVQIRYSAQKMENYSCILAYVGTLEFKSETYLIASETGSFGLLVWPII
jgi:hypothetical protein